jgi:hypothetical protein
MAELPNDPALKAAVAQYVTQADVKVASASYQGSGGIGEKSLRIIRRLVQFGRETLEGKNPLLNDGSISEERFARQMILDFINGRQIPYLMKEASEEPENFVKRTGKETVNLTKLILDLKCLLYKEAPDRRFLDEEGEEIDDEDGLKKIKHLYRRGGFNASMRDIDRYCYAFGYCAARWVRRPLSSKGEDKHYWTVGVIPPTDFDYITGPVEGMAVEEVKAMVFRSVIETDSGALTSKAVLRHEVYTDAHYAVYIDGKLEKVESNIYGRIPYVFCIETGNESERFRQPDMLESVTANSEIDRKLSLAGWSGTFSSMPVTVFTDNREELVDQSMVPGRILKLSSPVTNSSGGGSATMEFKAPQDRTQSNILHIKNDIALLLQSHGLHYSMTDGIKAGTSGAAVEVAQGPILSYMKARAQVDQVIETDLYRLLLDASSAEDPSLGLPEVDYVEVEYPFAMSLQSAEERRKDVEFKLKHGLIDKPRALRTLEPERFSSDQEAEEALPEEKEPIAGMGLNPELGEIDANGNIGQDGEPEPDGTGEPGVTGGDNPRNSGKQQPERAAAGNQDKRE